MVSAGGRQIVGHGKRVARLAAEMKATPSQMALAWLLSRSPVMLPIPGTSKVAHLEENVAAAALKIDASQLKEIARAAG